MLREPDQALILDGGSEPETHAAAAGGGQFVAYTCTAPYKETENEDTLAIIPCGPDTAVLVVADGVGGLPAGKRASLVAVTTLAASLRAASEDAPMLRTAILNGIEAANQAVQTLASGSATTLTVVTIEGITARPYQIGDSEALVVGQRGVVKLQTMAHSPTGFAVEAGFLDQRDALHHEERHIVSNLIGTSDMRIEVGAHVDLMPRDTVLVASDGLIDNVHTDEIIERIRKGPLELAADAVIALARRRMLANDTSQPSKPDDLSLILFRKPYRKKRRARSPAAQT